MSTATRTRPQVATMNAVHDLPDRMSFIQVDAPLHADDRHVVDVAETQIARVPDDLRCRQIGNLAVRNLQEIAEPVGERTEPAAEDDADARLPVTDLRANRAHRFIESSDHTHR